ncbi:bacteriochlorophyll 4-vinyl reductase [Alsobacter sp. R-9]
MQQRNDDRSDPRIGPNAIIQIAAVLRERHGVQALDSVFVRARLAHYLDALPATMVPEREVARLHAALGHELGADEAESVSREAGTRTAAYLLAHRIPAPARRLLRWLPARLAGPLLLAAIRRHAWTFAGSARFEAHAGPPVALSLTGCSLCRSRLAGGRLGAFYAATFEGLFRSLVHNRSHVETASQGWPVTWRARLDWRG